MIRVSIGVLIGAASLWLSFRGVSLVEVSSAFRNAHAHWVLAALIVSLVAIGAVVLRWRLLLVPGSPDFSILLKATLIGQMLNILLPLRLGEVARVFAAAKHGGLTMTKVTASLAMEKALDLTVFGVAAGGLVAATLVPGDVLATSRWLVLPVVAGLAIAITFVFGWFRVGPLVIAWTVAIFLLAAAGNQLLMVAFDLLLPWSAAVALLVVLQAGSVPPSLPGRLGVYNYLTVVTLEFYGVDRAAALSYSLGLYIVAYVPKLMLGGLIATDPAWRPSWRRPS